MKIAQVAPLYESVPPKLYGGTERVVSYLTEELVRQGHDVTLFASGDSMTGATLVPACPEALRLNPRTVDPLPHHFLMLEEVLRQRHNFDIVHFHIDYMHFPLSRREQLVHISTLHGRLDIPDLVPLYRLYSDMPVISISDAQRQPLPWINWQGTVHHGMPANHLAMRSGKGNYLAFLGRISPEKGLDQAIQIALRVGLPLKIAAKIDRADQEYFENVIKPQLDHPLVEFVGEIGYPYKNDFLGNALALLFPINWPEPFGLVMMESLACGTPVVAYPRGSVPEIIEHGVSGYLVHNVEEAAQALSRIEQIDRRRCRQCFEQRLTARRMCDDYIFHYERLVYGESEQIPLTDGVPVG
ncbi:MAG TPA: glycosyltransferase family 4 protein [Terriglobales bacterium]|nr:glycosyltransferase family 4 protein [Terriglobales bacterium]